MAYRMIQVGTGGRGRSWCQGILPPNIEDGLIEVVAAVDTNPEALTNARDLLGLPPEKCYTDLRRAFAENDADFCTVVVPPAFHEEVVDAALAHDMHILSEKPIADTLAASCRIAAKVRRAGAEDGGHHEPPLRPEQEDPPPSPQVGRAAAASTTSSCASPATHASTATGEPSATRWRIPC